MATTEYRPVETSSGQSVLAAICNRCAIESHRYDTVEKRYLYSCTLPILAEFLVIDKYRGSQIGSYNSGSRLKPYLLQGLPNTGTKPDKCCINGSECASTNAGIFYFPFNTAKC